MRDDAISPIGKEELQTGGDISDTVRAKLALEAGRMASFDYHMDTGLVVCDDKLRDLYGMPMTGDLMVDQFFAVIHPDDVPHVDGAITRAVEEHIDYRAEWRVILPNGKTRWLGGHGRIVSHDPEGNALRMLGINWDITDRKEQEQRLSLMAREMNHRVKNIFAMIAALIRIAKSRTSDVNAFADVLRSQVFALSDAHAITMEYARKDPGSANIPAVRIVDAALAAWRGDDGRVDLEVDVDKDVTLDARQTSALAMMLYELATNAAKYGALAHDGSSLTISLKCTEGGRCSLRWTEVLHGLKLNPIEAEQAGSNGFGAVLLRQSALALDGSMDMRFLSEGLDLKLSFPLEG